MSDARAARESLPDASNAERDRACLFCERLRSPGRLRACRVYEDGQFFVAHQLEEVRPTYLGALLLQTRRHALSLGALTEEEARGLGPVVSRVSRALEEVTGASWTYCFAFTEGYRHVHLVLVARYPGVPPEYVRLAITDWPDAPRGGPREVAELSGRLRRALASPASGPLPSRGSAPAQPRTRSR